jgi:glycosyltransferase involved in cell wall biosynthesis
MFSIIESLMYNYKLVIASVDYKKNICELNQRYLGKIVFLDMPEPDDSCSLISKVKRKINHVAKFESEFHKGAIRYIKHVKYDLLWIIHENTLFELKDDLNDKKYIVSFYELNDHRRGFLNSMKYSIQNAQEFMVPEYNRACILRVWLQLKKTPTVIPNKPLGHPLSRNIENPYSKELEGKKIILYQGYIQRSRNIDILCEACTEMPDYTIVLMGGGDQSYIDELKKKYPQIMHISFVTPPNHLYITSYALFAIVKYDFVVLNAIFCAPNKTWEYTGFGIPVLCHNIPGLEYTIGKYEAGICTDMDDKGCIKAAIQKMDANYEYYSNNAIKFYNSFDIKAAINGIVEKNI